ncbi:MAG: hypothetical protein JWM74_904 [Myxococcaceae bacterium]|nr:hypothetical protein [Myxococcaceae bacterium]
MRATIPDEQTAPARERVTPLHPNGPPHAPHAPPSLAAQEPRQLAELALAGDTGAWHLLIQKHNHRVVVSLLARGVRIDRAKDIAQDAWLRLIEQQRAGRLNQISLPGLAIAQAAFLACEAARRDASARRLAPLADDDGRSPACDVADPAADAETRLLGSERLACAEKVLARSSSSARTVFRLAYGNPPLAHVDIAREAGLSLQRVRQILCEVRKELRVALEVDGTEGVARG